MNKKNFDEVGIPIYKTFGGMAFSEAVAKHPELEQYVLSRDPLRFDRQNRDALRKLNQFIAQDIYQLEIDFSHEEAIIPTPVLRYNFLKLVLNPNSKVIELGTGGTAIIALLAARWFNCEVLATEIDQEYITRAAQNIQANMLENKIRVVDSNGKMLDGVIPQEFRADFIISNPPYYDEIRSPNVLWGGRKHELVGEGEHGEKFIIDMIREGWHFLNPGGVISFIIPKTRTETLNAVEEYLAEKNHNYDILGLQAGNRLRYIFRIFKSHDTESPFLSEME
jgi:tRNA1(Val) A37 N6-methylase TrmN6